MTRRVFLALVLCPLFFLSGTALAEFRVRLIASNLTSGPAQDYVDDDIRLLRGLQGIVDLPRPDATIGFMNEFNYRRNREVDIRSFVDQAFGRHFHYFREPGDATIPNGIVSELPFATRRENGRDVPNVGVIVDPRLNDRHIVWGEIVIPGREHLWIYSLHLSHGDIRARVQAAEIVQRDYEARVPDGAFAAVGGDVNVRSREELTFYVFRRFLSDRHIPVDANGNPTTNVGRTRPYDIVVPNPALDRHHACVQFVDRDGEKVIFRTGLVFDDEAFPRLSVLPGVRPGDARVGRRQHLAVLRDFLIP